MTAQWLARPQLVSAVYDVATQEIVRVYESQRDAQACCDKWNGYCGWDRYVIDSSDSSEWADDHVRWAD